jgi:hypothetical protein
MSAPFYANISKLFNIDPILTSEYIGTGLKNNRCRRRISANDRAATVRTLHSLQHLESIDEHWNQLHFIARNLLCQQHSHQLEILLEQWWLKLLALSSTKSPTPELRMPGAFPKDDENLMTAILELSKVDKKAQWREEAQAKAEQAKAEKAKAERVRANQAKTQAEAQRSAEARRAGKSRQQRYMKWVVDSEQARKSPNDVPFPDPPSYGCSDVACRAFQNEVGIDWCKHDIERLLIDGNVRWDRKELRKLQIIWHPDKFLRYPGWQSKAMRLFQMIPTR